MTATATPSTAALHVEYFTDPLCCWSWALEPVWRTLHQQHAGSLSRTVVLGGMIEGWAAYRDPLNAIGAPAHLAPLWHLVGRVAGVPIDPSIWHVDPPASSFPASVAAKAAALQGADAGDRYLALVREAVMTRRQNVARPDVLIAIAAELAAAMPDRFDPSRFAADLAGDAAADAFRADLQRTRFLRIGRFPTMIVHGPGGSRIAVGYRPAEIMEQIFAAVGYSAAGPAT